MVLIEPRRLKEKHYLIKKNKQKVLDISRAFDLYEKEANLVICHLSDFHFSRSFKPRRINRIIRSIMNVSPDLIVFTGDLIDNYEKWPAKETQRLIEKLKKMTAPMGKIAILGSHDYRSKGDNFVKAILTESDFTVLENEEIFGSNDDVSINIAGMDDTLMGNPQFQFERTLAQWHLLLVHEPDSVLNMEDVQHFDLVLAGHGHGGQVRFPFIFYKIRGSLTYTHGLYLLAKKTLLSISNGVGMSMLPLRFGVPPEVIYYHLNKQPTATKAKK
ncbi:metallophosphoesterase [Tetragenococcus muriaticus]|nr:metallophosphoesterase [Tetragenococcus muriaticus]GMA46075.1 metallophosphoesterase [Tetragenococcus muriaticus]GMA46234.1 metallophosphoesterase [Tetragenococcus muriaticus]